MGYRSDVALRIEMEDGHSAKELLKAIQDYAKNADEIEGKTTDRYDLLSRNADTLKVIDDKELTFGWNFIKWYEGYHDVDFVNDLIEEIRDILHFSEQDVKEAKEEIKEAGEKEPFLYPYIAGIHFVRLGEDYDDFEEMLEGDVQHPIGLVRYIDLDLDWRV